MPCKHECAIIDTIYRSVPTNYVTFGVYMGFAPYVMFVRLSVLL